jgi:hypothetical protein
MRKEKHRVMREGNPPYALHPLCIPDHLVKNPRILSSILPKGKDTFCKIPRDFNAIACDVT